VCVALDADPTSQSVADGSSDGSEEAVGDVGGELGAIDGLGTDEGGVDASAFDGMDVTPDGPTSDAQAGGDAASDSGMPADGGPCELVDDFNSTTMPSFWRSYSLGAPTFGLVRTGSLAQITPTPQSSGIGLVDEQFIGYELQSPVDLTMGGAALEIVLQPSQAVLYLVVTDGTNWFAGIFSGGFRQCDQNPPNGTLGSCTAPWSPIADRFERLRAGSPPTTAVWESSPDGANWTVWNEAPTSVNFQQAYVAVYGGYEDNVSDPGTMQFDNVSVAFVCR
jgi:hypothetical protein